MSTRKIATAREIRLLVVAALARQGVPDEQRDGLSLEIERKPRARLGQCNWTFAVDDGALPEGLAPSAVAGAITRVQMEYDLPRPPVAGHRR